MSTAARPGREHGEARQAGEDGDERHANNLELFLDLVFVFAVTQITATVAHERSWAGLGHAALVAWLVWWQWSQFSWAGAAVDLQRGPITRLLVLCAIPATLVMVVAIPRAFGSDGRWFGVAYLAVQALVLAMQGAEAISHERGRAAAFLRYTSMAAAAPIAVMVGGFLHGDARIFAWLVAAGLDVAAALLGAKGEWRMSAVHFAERHALFVIIALGEVLVGAGVTASKLGLDGHVFLGLAVSTGGACVIWWSYFAFIPHVAEHALRHHDGPRGVMARNLFTFGHFPIVAALIAYAVVVERVVHHPTALLPATERAELASTIGLLMIAYLNIQWHVIGSLAPERLLLIGAAAAWCALAGALPAAAVVGGVMAMLGLTQAITWRRFRHGALQAVSPNR